MAMRSSSSSASYGFAYDVFLGFRGEDTRYGFTGNLYKALCDRGIHAFIDDEELQRGDEITPALEKAIEESRIFIIVLSQNYASSSFCLNELAYIFECVKRKGLLVLPVFYNVDPSDVRHHRGSFGEALAIREEKFKGNMEGFEHNMKMLKSWKMALYQVANLSGYHFKHGDDYDYKFIGKIVQLVSCKINRVPLHVADYPVGLESQVLEVNSLLEVGSNDGVHMVGIHGIGGVGKTTLALAVYNSIADNFEGLCFLDDVREKSVKHGIASLHETLLSEIVGENIKIGSVSKGISIVKHRLQQKKVLLILDDVDKHEQLLAIVGRPDWFGPGSRIIITTRDKQLLACHEVNRKYEVKKLNKNDALQLLSWKAFKTEEVDPSYVDILNRVVIYASGLPLALEVIGSNLFGRRIEEWESAMNRYERIPNNQILKVLKRSFDALEEEEKSVFLDIACCFKGYELAEVKDILHAHYGDCMKYHIKVLVEKSLIKLNVVRRVTMHDLIEDMGKEIVRQKSPKEPGKRSRLWSPEDIIQVLKDNLKFVNMSVLNFNNCEGLTQIPDVSELPNLEKFSFQNCKNLITIHDSVGFLNKLKLLDAFGCSKVRSFPPLKLISLEKIYLSYCSHLESFPEILGKMENITELVLEASAIKEFPFSFHNLNRLQTLQLRDCGMFRFPSCIVTMPKLVIIIAWQWKGWLWPKQVEVEEKLGSIVSSNVDCLYLSGCNLSDDFFPMILTWFANVKDLDLSRNKFTVLPECINECLSLRKLNLDYCQCLQEIRGIPPNIEHFSARNCESLTSSCRSALLNQKVHEAGNTMFWFSGEGFPVWFDLHGKGLSNSFWFRTTFPAIATCITIGPRHEKYVSIFGPIVIINGNECKPYCYECHRWMEFDHTHLFDLQNIYSIDNLINGLLENEWNHVQITYSIKRSVEKEKHVEIPACIESGIYIFKQRSIMDDIRFTDPYNKERKLDDDSES